MEIRGLSLGVAMAFVALSAAARDQPGTPQPATILVPRAATTAATESTTSNSQTNSEAHSRQLAESLRRSNESKAAEAKARTEEAKGNDALNDFMGGLFGDDSGRSEPIARTIAVPASRPIPRVKANEIICRGGSTYPMALMQRATRNGKDRYLMYFIASDASVSGNATSLDIGKCAILDGSFVDGRAGSLQLMSNPGTGEGSATSIAESLMRPENYWRFIIKRDSATGALQAVSQQPL